MQPIQTIARCTMLPASRAATFLIHVVAVLLVSEVTYAQSQNARDVINFFNSAMRAAIVERVKVEWINLPHPELFCIEQRLQQQGNSVPNLIERGITPSDARLSSLRLGCRTPALPPQVKSATLPLPERELADRDIDPSAKPTFDCTRAISPTARIICLDPDGAKADWDLILAYWARSFSLVGNARDRFQQAHDDWFPTLKRSCNLQAEQRIFSAGQRQCVLTAYRKRSQSYRSQLRGDALAKSTLSPEQHVEVQRELIARKFLDDDADGIFGPNTRAAIRRFQAQSGFAESDFLTPQQRQRLLQTELETPQAPSQPALPPKQTEPETPQAPSQPALPPKQAQEQCQSKDAEKRLSGCTAIIDRKGEGFSIALADALDGRCWAYNDLGSYERAVTDCKAAIALNRRHSYAFNNLGTSFLGLRDTTNAIAAFTKSIELKSSFVYPRLGRAKAYVASGNKALAREDYASVLTIDPTNQEARRGITELAIETTLLRDARRFLDDVQKFIAKQTSVERIGEIAREAAYLRIALDSFDETTAVQSKKKLSDLLEPINGFLDFLKERQAERDRDTARRLAVASAEAEKNIYFIDEYLRQYLGDKKRNHY